MESRRVFFVAHVFFVELFWEKEKFLRSYVRLVVCLSLLKKLRSISYFRPQSTVDGSEILHELIYRESSIV